MLVENQKVEVRWRSIEKKKLSWYQEKGYDLTGNTIIIKVEDLLPSSGKLVNVLCDCEMCKNHKHQLSVRYCDYMENISRNNGRYYCKSCRSIRNNIKTEKSRIIKFMDTAKYFCNLKGYEFIGNYDDFVGKQLETFQYICPKHGLQTGYLSNFKNGSGCNKCGNETIGKKLSLKSHEVQDIIESKNNNVWMNPLEYIGIKTKNLIIKCGKCNKNTFVTSLSNYKVSKLCMCEECLHEYLKQHNRKMKTVDVINEIESKNNNKLLNPDEYINYNTSNLIVECGSCGNTFTTSLANYIQKKEGKCIDCSETSYGEHIISKYLDKYRVTYSRQEHFDGDCRDIKPLPFDFYLPEYNTCIEYDGLQHFEPRFGEKAFFKTLLHDGMKNNYCKWNHIRLIRIPYWERDNIEQILIKELNLAQQEKSVA